MSYLIQLEDVSCSGNAASSKNQIAVDMSVRDDRGRSLTRRVRVVDSCWSPPRV